MRSRLKIFMGSKGQKNKGILFTVMCIGYKHELTGHFEFINPHIGQIPSFCFGSFGIISDFLNNFIQMLFLVFVKFFCSSVKKVCLKNLQLQSNLYGVSKPSLASFLSQQNIFYKTVRQIWIFLSRFSDA